MNTDTKIKASIESDTFYQLRNLERIIHYNGYSVAKHLTSSLRGHSVEWILFIDNADTASFDTLNEAREHGDNLTIPRRWSTR